MARKIFGQGYGGTWPTMVTPFDKNLKIDFAVLREMVDWYLQFQIGGLYPNCLSSEMYFLTNAERLRLASETVKNVAGRTKVVATANFGDSLQAHIRFAKKMADTGVDALMFLVPEFLNEDEALENYFLSLADAVSLPCGIYECPEPRVYHLGLDLVKKLADSGRFVAYKETSCDLQKILAIHQITRKTPLTLLQANAPYLLAASRAGVPGSMNIASIWLADIAATIIRLAQENDPLATSLHQKFCALEMIQRCAHPVSSKYLLARRGVPIATRARCGDAGFTAEVRASLDFVVRNYLTEDGQLIL